MKATNWKISQKFLDYKSPKKAGFTTPKWIQFCLNFINHEGLEMRLYEARKTNSKYISLKYKEKEFKVRFSDHKPIKSREADGDCDFFVGRTNFKVTNTEMAISAVQQWLQSLG